MVRIEASRLRRSLERYYLRAGGNDPVRIVNKNAGKLSKPCNQAMVDVGLKK
jgi:hypothetical protein